MRDTRYLTLRNGNTWNAIVKVPRKLRRILHKSGLLRSLQTRDLVVAQRKRWPVVAEFNQIIDGARRQLGAGEVMGAAAEWREHIRRLKQGDRSHVWDSRYAKGSEDLRQAALFASVGFVEEDAAEIAAEYGPETATAFYGVATGRATPLLYGVEDALREGGQAGPANLRTQSQIRSAIMRFGSWCERSHVPPTVEAITRVIAGRYATEAVREGIDPATWNKHCSALSGYWRWLNKRAGIEGNPWSGQRRSKAAARNGEKAKRPFTDGEVRTLLQGNADRELHDAMRVAGLSGMRLEEIYRLKVADCAYGIFNIRQAKSAAGVRVVPIHSALVEIVDRRTEGQPATAYLFPEAGPARPGRERSMAISKKFGRYRIGLGVEDRDEGKRHSKVDFHSWRRTFITKARNAGIDQATVAKVVGHVAGNITDDVYNGGAELAMRRACVEAVRLP